MTQKVFELLRQACDGKGGEDFVLTRRGGKPIKDFRNDWRQLCCEAGLGKFLCLTCSRTLPFKTKRCDCGSRKRKYQGLIPHDLRRSAAKAARRAGIPESVVMAMGGWKTSAVFRRYAIVSSADQRAAAEMLERAQREHAATLAPTSAPAASAVTEANNVKVQ